MDIFQPDAETDGGLCIGDGVVDKNCRGGERLICEAAEESGDVARRVRGASAHLVAWMLEGVEEEAAVDAADIARRSAGRLMGVKPGGAVTRLASSFMSS